MHSRTLAAVAFAAAVLMSSRAACGGGRRRGDAAPCLPDGRHVARQLRRAGARRRSRHLLDADGGGARTRRCTSSTCRPRASTGIGPMRYAATARASHYVETQAENDYAALSNDVAATLNEVALTAEPAQRLAIVERARQTLADWPQSHFNYRAAEVRQMLGMLDEAIADLQAARGAGALRAEPVRVRRSAGHRRAAAAAADAPGGDRADADGGARGRHERRADVAAGDGGRRDRSREGGAAGGLGGERRAPTPQAEIATELKLDRAYQALTARTMALADRRAKLADVRGLERLVSRHPAARCRARREAARRGRRADRRRWRRSSTRRGSCSSRAIAGRCARRSCGSTASRSARRWICSRS